MSVSLTNLRYEVYRVLGEASNTTVGGLPSGSSSTLTVANDTGVDLYLNLAQSEVAQQCVPINGSGTNAAYTAGDKAFPLSGFTVATGSLWFVQQVAFDGTMLTYVAPDALDNWYPNRLSASSGTPLYWTTTRGNRASITLYPAPATVLTITAYGLLLPQTLGDGTGGTTTDASFAADDQLLELLPPYAALKIAMNHQESPSLYDRLKDVATRSLQVRRRLWESLPATFKDGPNAPYATPPLPYGPIGGG